MNNLIRLRLYLIGIVAAVAAVFVMPSMAFAQDGAPVTVEGAGSEYVLSPFIWKTITAIVIPIVIFLITKASANPTFKVILALVVAAVDALIIRWTKLDGSMVFDQAALQDVFHVYAIQALTYFGLNKTHIPSMLAPERGLG